MKKEKENKKIPRGIIKAISDETKLHRAQIGLALGIYKSTTTYPPKQEVVAEIRDAAKKVAKSRIEELQVFISTL